MGVGVATLLLAGLVVFYSSKPRTVAISAVTPQPSTSTGSTPGVSTQPTSIPVSSSIPAPTSTPSLPRPTGLVLNKETVSLASSDPRTNADMDSTCQTIANANCGIELKGPNNEAKTISPRAADSQGGVDLVWNAKSLGLAIGTWRVRLVASSGSLASTSAYYSLQVQP
jgi:hypothetical protein